MKILAVSDQVVQTLYTPSASTRFREADLVIGCGDLPYPYLEYLVTTLNIPLVYVPGNHDPLYSEWLASARAEGGLNIDRRLETVKGLRVAGLGGSVRYRPDGTNQYSQAQMYKRLLPLLLPLAWDRLRGRRLDILVTHSPPRGIHDDDDPAHVGLSALNSLVHWFRPRYLLHGHTVFYKQNLIDPVTWMDGTMVVNVYPYRIFEAALDERSI